MLLFTKSGRREPTGDWPHVHTDKKGRPYALGLTWVDADTPEAARKRAREGEHAAFCFIPRARQVGLTTHGDHFPRKQTFAAAAAAVQLHKSRRWAAIYKIPETAAFDAHYWQIIVNDGKIIRDEVLAYDDAVLAAQALTAPSDQPAYQPLLIDGDLASNTGHESIGQVLGRDRDPLLIQTRRTYSLPALDQLPAVPAWVAGLVLVASIGATWALTSYFMPTRIETRPGETKVVEKLVPLLTPVRTIADPAYLLVACERALGALIAQGSPADANATCFAPTGTATSWTAQITYAARSPFLAVSATVHLPPDQTISSAESGFTGEVVIDALTKLLPAALVKLEVKTEKRTERLAAQKPATPANPGVSLGMLNTASLNAAAGAAGAAAEAATVERTTTHLTLSSRIAPSQWAERLGRTPLALEQITRTSTGDWIVKGRVL